MENVVAEYISELYASFALTSFYIESWNIVYVLENTYRQWHIKEILSFQIFKIKRYTKQRLVSYVTVLPLCA